MRIPITKYGLPQVVVFSAILIVLMVIALLVGKKHLPIWATVAIEVILLIVLVWVLSFFRDPFRATPTDKNLLTAPADGKVTDIEIVDENQFIQGKALRIGIFLSIFNVHINRAPCDCIVEKITYKKGKFKNAMDPESGRINESNDLYITRAQSPQDKLIVRQISGAIARHIVCKTAPGQKLTAGQQFGMIKFGSRTEL
ncbi:MAG: phosphatidylserine decarboxylase, partial [Planctomycetes bacterium]|nr:phosphatidylserine decarboxylase [Planctomycetota bacterium]